MTLTLGELVLRRRLESQEVRGGLGPIYLPGQYHAVVTGDDAILSFVDIGGWAVQMFVQYRDAEWIMKTDRFLAINTFGMEVRHIAMNTRLSGESVRALESARTKKAPRQQRQREAPSDSTG